MCKINIYDSDFSFGNTRTLIKFVKDNGIEKKVTISVTTEKEKKIIEEKLPNSKISE